MQQVKDVGFSARHFRDDGHGGFSVGHLEDWGLTLRKASGSPATGWQPTLQGDEVVDANEDVDEDGGRAHWGGTIMRLSMIELGEES